MWCSLIVVVVVVVVFAVAVDIYRYDFFYSHCDVSVFSFFAAFLGENGPHEITTNEIDLPRMPFFAVVLSFHFISFLSHTLFENWFDSH